MRKLTAVLLFGTVLASGVFAAAAIGGHGGLFRLLTGTTLTSTTPGQRRVVICHGTGSRRHPHHTITVAQPAVAAHLAHGDTLGPCAPPPVTSVTTTTLSVTTATGLTTTVETPVAPGHSGDHDQGHGHH
jgi:hypothetical protein